MLLICTAYVVTDCRRTWSKHGTSAQTKDAVCDRCKAAMARNGTLHDQYLASILKGTDHGSVRKGERVRR